MESKKDIGKIFRNGLQGIDKSPSADLWQKIEADLDKKKRRKRALWLFSGIFLCIVFLGGSFLRMNFQNITPSGSERNLERNLEGNSETSSEINLNGDQTKIDNDLKTKVDKLQSEKAVSERSIVGTNLNSSSANISNFSKQNRKQNKNHQNKSLIFDPNRTDSETISQNNLNDGKGKRENIFVPNDSTSTENTIAENKKTEKKKQLPNTEKESEKKLEQPYDEFHVSAYCGLNYGGYFGDFTPISNNEITKESPQIQSVYGILGRFMFDENLGIQLGVGKIHNRYFSTIEKPGTDFINTQNVSTNMLISELNSVFQNETKVRFRYESEYVEIPLEAYYVVRERNVGVAFSAGVSMLLAGKNKIFASSENVEQMEIGHLKTTISSGFTANAKVYLFYKLTPSLQVELFPSMQYRIMGDTDNSNYSSYFFSVRSGLTYKF